MWGMTYIPLEEAGPMKPPCQILGHFYENYECIYCSARYCDAEMGGHSFETSTYAAVRDGTSPLYCSHCERQVVNIIKGVR